MHGQFWAIWLLKNSSQAMSEYSYCENDYPTFALWRKYPISYQNFRIWNMPTFDQLDSFSIFYFAHDESLKPFSLHQIYRKWIQQCLQTIKLFRNVQKTFFTSVFSAFNFCINIPIPFLLTFNNYWMRLSTIWRIIKPEVCRYQPKPKAEVDNGKLRAW